MLPENITLRRLRLLLTNLVPPTNIKIILDDAGIHLGNINLQDSPNNIWHSVLTEAKNQNRLDELISIVHEDYPGNSTVVNAYNDYLRVQGLQSSMVTTLFDPIRIDGLSITWGLWPLSTKEDAVRQRDANYDFPVAEEDFLELGEGKVYYPVYDQRNRKEVTEVLPQILNAEEFCTNYLLRSIHQLIVGRRWVGKTWLRLYLERYVLITNVACPPIFFFVPTHLLFQPNELQVVQSLVRSIAHQLFLRLLVQAEANPDYADTLLISGSGIARLLKEYKYDIYRDGPLLVRPIPPDSLLDIEQRYGSNQTYLKMKQLILNTPSMSVTTSPTVDQILDHVTEALESLGYKKLFIMIDNWDQIGAPQRNSLLTQLLSPSLLAKLAAHNLYFKAFLPAVSVESIKHFQVVMAFERQIGNDRLPFSLYAYS